MARRERGTVGPRPEWRKGRARTGRRGAVSDTRAARGLDRPGLGRHRSAKVAGPAGPAAAGTEPGPLRPPADRRGTGRRPPRAGRATRERLAAPAPPRPRRAPGARA